MPRADVFIFLIYDLRFTIWGLNRRQQRERRENFASLFPLFAPVEFFVFHHTGERPMSASSQPPCSSTSSRYARRPGSLLSVWPTSSSEPRVGVQTMPAGCGFSRPVMAGRIKARKTSKPGFGAVAQ